MTATPFAITEAPLVQVTTMLSAKLAASGSNLTTQSLRPSQVLSIKTARPSYSREENESKLEAVATRAWAVSLDCERKTNARSRDRSCELFKFHKRMN